MNLAARAIKDIQYSTNLSVENIGKKIGYTRQYLQALISGKVYNDSYKVESLLREKFWDSFDTDVKLEYIMRELVEVKSMLVEIKKAV